MPSATARWRSDGCGSPATRSPWSCCSRILRPTLPHARDLEGQERFTLEVGKSLGRSWRFEAEEAERCLGVLLPAVNRTGGDRATVQEAVSGIEEAGHPERFLYEMSTGYRFMNWRGKPGYLTKMPKPTRLALEMALHEEQERRAMEGELWRLERAWEEAEEIAAIADDLLLPEGTEEFIEEHRPTD